MRVSREQVAENRRKILEVASRLFRERGFDAVTVADVMSAAGLTHGGFYGYFKSKDDLIARRAAIGSWAAMVGAVILARLTDDAALSDEMLSETLAFIDEHLPHDASAAS